MKKLVCIVLAMLMVFGLAACSNSGEPAATQSASAEETVEETVEAEASADASTEGSASAETAAYSGEEMALIFSSFAVENSIDADAYRLFKEQIEEATNGKVTVELYFNSSLYPQNQELDALIKGNIDFMTCGVDALGTYIEEWNIAIAPYVFKNVDHYFAFFESEAAQELFDRTEEELGVSALATYYQGARHICLNEDIKITSRDDLKSIKLRVPGSDACMKLAEALGTNPVSVGYADTYLAIQTGTVDGLENPIPYIRTNSFYEVSESMTLNGHQISGGNIMINTEKWQSMSPELQQIIQDAAEEACLYMTDTVKAKEEEDIAWLKEKGLIIYELTDEELESYRQEVLEYYLANNTVDMDLFQSIQDLLQ